MWICVSVCRCLWRPEEGAGSSGAGVTGRQVWATWWCGCWKPNSGRAASGLHLWASLQPLDILIAIHKYLCACMSWTQEPERASDPSAAITGGCEPPCMGELNSGPQEEQQVLFTTEWSLQHHNGSISFSKCQMFLNCFLLHRNTVLQILFLVLFLVFWVFFVQSVHSVGV